MRTVQEIRAELASVITRRKALMAMQRQLYAKRKELLAERAAAIRARNIEMLRLFDDTTASYNAIGIRCEMSPHTVKVMLAKRGRNLTRRQMRWAQDRADRLNAGELVDAEHS